MTSDARDLTAGATGKDLVLAAIVRSVLDAAGQAGIAPSELLAHMGLKLADFDDPDGLVPLEAYIAAWEFIAARPDQAELGLRLGALSSPRFLGALGYAMVHAADGIAAVRLFHRFRALVSNALAPEIDIDDRHVTYHLVWSPRVARIVQFADCAFVGMLAMFGELVGLPKDTVLAAEAHYQCARPEGPDRSELLRCPVRYGAPETRFVLHRKPLEKPLPRRDPALFAYLERHASSVLARVPATGRTADHVRRLITEELRNGEPGQSDVSRRLAMSERTLQRRLREESTSFAEILDSVRAELSQLYLREANVAAYEVAFLLGYSEPSAFHRAFRRWTGVTPQEFRRRSPQAATPA